MKCPNCGRENPDLRLFCSRCGELLPEKDEAIDDFKSDELKPDEIKSDEIISNIADAPEIDEDMDFFTRRERERAIQDDDWDTERVPVRRAKPKTIFDGTEDDPKDDGSPYSRKGRRARADGPVRASTIVPRRYEPDDDGDFFDVAAPAAKKRRAYDSQYADFDERSFFSRHVRGIVGFSLLIITALIVFIWAITANGQLVLAQFDIAWQPDAYSKLGLEAYEKGDYLSSGHYFDKAISIDKSNASYAIYCANSYIELGDTENAVRCIKHCITLSPTNADLYIALKGQYANAETIPEEISQLITQGYNLTGDERLKQ